MSLPEKVAAAEAAKAGEGAKAPKVASKDNDAVQVFQEQGHGLRAQQSEDQKALEGSKSDKVAFVCALGDPKKKANRKQDGQQIPSYQVVGYKFKFLEDTVVPVVPYKDGAKELIDVVSEVGEKTIPAGTVAPLNLVETAMLISRVEYAGLFTGEGTTVKLSAKKSNNREDLLPILLKDGGGSIKEVMELIADIVGADPENGVKGTAKIKDEYADSFSGLYVRKSIAKRGGASAQKPGEKSADFAAAFRNFYAKKQA